MNVLLILFFVLIAFSFIYNAVKSYQEYLKKQRNPGTVRKGAQLVVADPYTGSKLAPNVSTFIQRAITKEHFYTNDLGFRVERKGLKQSVPVDIAFIGCSWVMGVGVEYEQTYVYKVSKMLNANVANLGVGTYSITQAIRILEKNIDLLKPRIIVYGFLNGHISRDFRTNTFEGILRRPIYVYYKNKKKIQIMEPRYNPSNKCLETYSYYKMYPSIPHDYSFKDIYGYTIRQIIKLNSMVSNGAITNLILKRLGLKRWRYGDSYLEENRKTIINDAISRLHHLSQKYSSKVLIHNLFHYKMLDMHNKQSVRDKYKADTKKDLELFGKAIKSEGAKDIFFVSIDQEKELYDNWLKKNGFKYGHYLEAIHLPGTNHPNEIGNGIIAESIAKQIKKYCVL